MGARGPGKKPDAAKKRDKTFRADRDGGLQLPANIPPVPDWLGAEGREEWERRAPQLERAGLLSEVDQVTFGIYCQAYEQLVRSLKLINDEEDGGYTTKTEKNNIIQHPAVSIMHKARADLIKLGREFGMTPSARSGLNIGSNEDDDDPLSDMQNERKSKAKK